MPPCPRLAAASMVLACTPLWAAGAAACRASSPAQVLPVVELYTSEGCSSCPPADRWLSRLAPGSPTVALAFHVDYWDRLGWKDRHASAEYTQRQSQQQAAAGSRFVYTPQVLIDGVDRKDWSALAAPPAAAVAGTARVAITLERAGDAVRATVTPLVGAPARLAAYWAVTEDGHVSDVRAGENRGETLHHDHVVRDYRPVAPWAADAGRPAALEFRPTGAAEAGHPRTVNLVVTEAATGRPLQAIKLGC